MPKAIALNEPHTVCEAYQGFTTVLSMSLLLRWVREDVSEKALERIAGRRRRLGLRLLHRCWRRDRRRRCGAGRFARPFSDELGIDAAGKMKIAALVGIDVDAARAGQHDAGDLVRA